MNVMSGGAVGAILQLKPARLNSCTIIESYGPDYVTL